MPKKKAPVKKVAKTKKVTKQARTGGNGDRPTKGKKKA